jgi:hypothetical protein
MPTRTSAFRARKLDWKSFVLGDFFSHRTEIWLLLKKI